MAWAFTATPTATVSKECSSQTSPMDRGPSTRETSTQTTSLVRKGDLSRWCNFCCSAFIFKRVVCIHVKLCRASWTFGFIFCLRCTVRFASPPCSFLLRHRFLSFLVLHCARFPQGATRCGRLDARSKTPTFPLCPPPPTCPTTTER